VTQGQILGFSGNTGFSTGPHVHFEVRFDGAPLDPLRIIPAR
jgi:murein DD-endopeptidase MepM/ murein hydrolase activator NlpD